MTFDDVKGCDEAKQELQEVVEFLMNPDKFSALGQTRLLYVRLLYVTQLLFSAKQGFFLSLR